MNTLERGRWKEGTSAALRAFMTSSRTATRLAGGVFSRKTPSSPKPQLGCCLETHFFGENCGVPAHRQATCGYMTQDTAVPGRMTRDPEYWPRSFPATPNSRRSRAVPADCAKREAPKPLEFSRVHPQSRKPGDCRNSIPRLDTSDHGASLLQVSCVSPRWEEAVRQGIHQMQEEQMP